MSREAECLRLKQQVAGYSGAYTGPPTGGSDQANNYIINSKLNTVQEATAIIIDYTTGGLPQVEAHSSIRGSDVISVSVASNRSFANTVT